MFCERLTIGTPLHFSSSLLNETPDEQTKVTSFQFPLTKDPHIDFIASLIKRIGQGPFIETKGDKTLFYLPGKSCQRVAQLLTKQIVIKDLDSAFKMPLGKLLEHLYKNFSHIIEGFWLSGSTVYTLCGKEGFEAYFESIGCLDLFKEQPLFSCEELSKSHSDIDISFYAPQATHTQVKYFVKCALDYIFTYSQNANSEQLKQPQESYFSKNQPYDNGFESGHILSFGGPLKKEVDILLMTKRVRSYICHADHVTMPIDLTTLISLIENPAKQVAIPIVGHPTSFAERFGKIYHDNSPNSLNIIGAIRQFSYAAQGYVMPSKLLQEKLLCKVSSQLQSSRSFKAVQPDIMKPFCSVLEDHLPANSGSEAAFTYALLDLYAENEHAHLISLICRQRLLKSTPLKHGGTLDALHRLFLEEHIDTKVLKAFLSVHALLLTLRSRRLNQKTPLTVTAYHCGVDAKLKIAFPYEDRRLYLHASNAINQSLQELEKAKLVPSIFKQLKSVESDFFFSMAPLSLNKKLKEEVFCLQETKNQAAIALKFIKSPPLEIIGYCLLCHCAYLTKSKSYLDGAAKALFRIFHSQEDAQVRRGLLMLFFNCCQSVNPKCFTLTKKEYRHMAAFENDKTKEQRILSLGLIFSCVHDPLTFNYLYVLWQDIAKEGKCETAKEMYALIYANKKLYPERALMLLRGFMKRASTPIAKGISGKIFVALCKKFKEIKLKEKRLEVLMSLETIARFNLRENVFSSSDFPSYSWLIEELTHIFPLDAYNLMQNLDRHLLLDNCQDKKLMLWQKLFEVYLEKEECEQKLLLWQDIWQCLQHIEKSPQTKVAFKARFNTFCANAIPKLNLQDITYWLLLFKNLASNEANTHMPLSAPSLAKYYLKWLQQAIKLKLALDFQSLSEISSLFFYVATNEGSKQHSAPLLVAFIEFIDIYYKEKLPIEIVDLFKAHKEWIANQSQSALLFQENAPILLCQLLKKIDFFGKKCPVELSNKVFTSLASALRIKTYRPQALDAMYKLIFQEEKKTSLRTSKELFHLYLSLALAYIDISSSKEAFAIMKHCFNLVNSIKNKDYFNTTELTGPLFKIFNLSLAANDLQAAQEVLQTAEKNLPSLTEQKRSKGWQQLVLAYQDRPNIALQILEEQCRVILAFEKMPQLQEVIDKLLMHSEAKISSIIMCIERYGYFNATVWHKVFPTWLQLNPRSVIDELLKFPLSQKQTAAALWQQAFASLCKSEEESFAPILENIEKILLVMEDTENSPQAYLHLAIGLMKLLHSNKYRHEKFYRVYEIVNHIKDLNPKAFYLQKDFHLTFAKSFINTRNPKVFISALESIRHILPLCPKDKAYQSLVEDSLKCYFLLAKDKEVDDCLWRLAKCQRQLDPLGLGPYINFFASSEFFIEEAVEMAKAFTLTLNGLLTTSNCKNFDLAKQGLSKLNEMLAKSEYQPCQTPYFLLEDTFLKLYSNKAEYARELAKVMLALFERTPKELHAQRAKVNELKERLKNENLEAKNAIVQAQILHKELQIFTTKETAVLSALQLYKEHRQKLCFDPESSQRCARKIFAVLISLSEHFLGSGIIEEYRDLFYVIKDKEKALKLFSDLGFYFKYALEEAKKQPKAPFEAFLAKKTAKGPIYKELIHNSGLKILDPNSFHFLLGLLETIKKESPLDIFYDETSAIYLTFWSHAFIILELYPTKGLEIYNVMFDLAFNHFEDVEQFQQVVETILIFSGFIRELSGQEISWDKKVQLMLLNGFTMKFYEKNEFLNHIEIRADLIERLAASHSLPHFYRALKIIEDVHFLLKKSPQGLLSCYMPILRNFKSLPSYGPDAVAFLGKLLDVLMAKEMHLGPMEQALIDAFEQLFVLYFECLTAMQPPKSSAKEVSPFALFYQDLAHLETIPWVASNFKLSFKLIDIMIDVVVKENRPLYNNVYSGLFFQYLQTLYQRHMHSPQALKLLIQTLNTWLVYLEALPDNRGQAHIKIIKESKLYKALSCASIKDL